VILHEDLTVVQRCKEIISEWLKDMGLELKPSKTRLTHTLRKHVKEQPGFNFLGFSIRQSPVGKYSSGKSTHGKSLGFKTIITPSKQKQKLHYNQIASIIKTHKTVPQKVLINHLNPIIRGWANYYATVVSKKTYKKKVLDFCKRIGEEIKKLNGATQERVIKKLNLILRGFANYYKGVVSKETFGYISYRIWQYLWRWAKRRHPNKSTKWVKDKYFKTINNVKWRFATTVRNRRGKEKDLVLFDIAYTPIVRHIKVKGDVSPDNPEIKEYWEKRRKKHGKSYWEKNSKLYNVAENQGWKCPICGKHLFNDEGIETHHIVPVKDGGSDDTENLIHLHVACHKQEHSKSKNSRLK
jgi:Group II intron, maturase-specific domain/HNH endonuclease